MTDPHLGLLTEAYNLTQVSEVFNDKLYGIVVDNDDPLQLSRVKCEIPGRVDKSGTTPWVYREQGTGRGGSNDFGTLDIPEIGTKVSLKYDQKDPYHITYTNLIRTDDETKPKNVKELYLDYPNCRGYLDKQGTGIVINEKEQTIHLTHVSGLDVLVSKEGTVTAKIPKDLIASMENVDIQAKDVGIKCDNFTIEAKSKYKLSSPEVDVN